MSDLSKYIGNVEEFPSLPKWDFFNHAGASPLPRRVAQAVRTYVDDTEQNGYLVGNRYSGLQHARELAARMIHAASADEIALLKNTAEGISIVARAIDFRPGDRIVSARGEYPANIYPWMDACRRTGAELVLVPETADDAGVRTVSLDAILAAAYHPRTRVVALSHVEFGTGQRLDVARVGEFCRTRGKLFCLDAIQSLGALPVDVQAMTIDYLSAGAQKWMLGAEGSAVFYCRRELLDRTPPLVVGAINVVNNLAYGDYDYTLQASAGRFESGTYNMGGIDAMKAAMELLLALGADAVSARIKEITDRLVAGLRAKGYTVASPRDGQEWSGIVSFSSPIHDHNDIARRFRKAHQTEIVVREGRLRASPHFYNTEGQIDRLIDRLPGH
jgi:selenocysteine lyase/cysteine desulfurase